MNKKRVRLTESQLVNLIRKSLIMEGEPAVISDTDLEKYGKQIADIMAKDDVETSDLSKIQRILNSYIFNAKTDNNRCALERLEVYYSDRAEYYDDWTYGDTGDSNTLYEDIDEVSVNSDTIKNELLQSITDNKNGFCKNLANPPAPPPAAAGPSKNMDCAGTFYTYGEAGKEYGEMDWEGGKLSFYLTGEPLTKYLGPGYPPTDNVMFVKGGKKWTTVGSCSPGGPGQPRGLVLGNWTLKK